MANVHAWKHVELGVKQRVLEEKFMLKFWLNKIITKTPSHWKDFQTLNLLETLKPNPGKKSSPNTEWLWKMRQIRSKEILFCSNNC